MAAVVACPCCYRSRAAVRFAFPCVDIVGRHRVGIYVLADDGVADWATALFSSLEIEVPRVPVYCIPFSDRMGSIEKLTEKYRFHIVGDDSLSELDAIGRRLYGCMNPSPRSELAGAFRKFYAFWGPLDRFMYVDSDVVVLNGFAQLFRHEIESPYALTYAHEDIGQVYKPGPLRERMVQECRSRGINTGLWASRKNLFSLAQIQAYAAMAESIAEQFVVTLEQPFLNYCLDLSGVDIGLFDPGLDAAWAGDNRLSIRLEGGRMHVKRSAKRLAPAIHWAGYPLSADMPYFDVYQYFRGLELRRRRRLPFLLRALVKRGLVSAPAALLRRLIRS